MFGEWQDLLKMYPKSYHLYHGNHFDSWFGIFLFCIFDISNFIMEINSVLLADNLTTVYEPAV
jgi:hypothetical protein